MGKVKEYGTSCRKLLRAADTVGVSGALLGAHVSGARARKEREGEASSAGIEHGSHRGTRRRDVWILRGSLKAI
jgi:hypothetical protein